MRRGGGGRLVAVVLLAVVLLAVVLLAGGCSRSGRDGAIDNAGDNEGAVMGVEELRPKAAEITDALAAGEWAQVRAEFDENMKDKLAEDGLANAWAQVVKAKGAYRSRGEPVQVATPAGEDVLVFDTPLAFEGGDMKSRLAFHGDGTLAGLFILVPDA